MKTLITIIVGAALAVAGYWFSVNVHIDFIDNLNKQGIPLDLGKSISMIGMFILLFPVLRIFYFQPLSDAINERTTNLEETFSEAESLRSEMTQMRTEYEQRLSAAEASTRAQIQEEIKKAQELRKKLEADATAKADEYRKKAIEEINAEKDRIVTNLRLSTVNLTLAATEKLLGEKMDEARDRKLVEEFIANVEVPA